MKKIYFPNLNGLRFFAALMVIFHHIELLKLKFEYRNSYEYPFFSIIGKLGVVLFFVLSGFLITYLLLIELKESKTVNIKAFYVRRILRIWPLYFLIVILGLFIIPQMYFLERPGQLSSSFTNDLIPKLLLLIFMLPNLALVLFSPIPYVSQVWSIGVEEQFYLFWPVLIKRAKNFVLVFVKVISLYWFVRFFLILLNQYEYSPVFKYLLGFVASFNIDCMAIGGLFAYIYFSQQEKLLKILYLKFTQVAVALLTISLIGFGIRIPYPFYALLFAIIILNAATNSKNIYRFENMIFNYLGKISYGLYMFHSIVIGTCIYFLSDDYLVEGYWLYILSILLSICVSALSYHFYEARFIKMKHKYSVVLSGDLAKETSLSKKSLKN